MDHRNRSIPLDSVNSFDVNKAIQRSLTKAVARHGLGLYIYAGEDLPEGDEKPTIDETPVQSLTCKCANCGKEIPDYFDDNGKKISASRWASGTFKKYGKYLCKDCIPFED